MACQSHLSEKVKSTSTVDAVNKAWEFTASNTLQYNFVKYRGVSLVVF